MNLSNVFLGGVTGEHRKSLRVLLEYYRNKGVKRLFIPCTGQNTITKTALEAGFQPEQIFTSDISLFSTVLGYLYQDTPIAEAGFEIKNPEYKEWYDEQDTEVKRVAVLMFIMKMNQLREGVFYENSFRTEMSTRRDHYLNKLVAEVQKNYDTFKGVHYSQMDVRDIFREGFGLLETDMVIMNPPAYAKGYEKMFDFHEDIGYSPEFAEFDFGKEWVTLFYQSIAMHNPMLWYTSKDIRHEVDKEHIVYAAEDGNDKYTYILVNIPDTVEQFPDRYMVKFKNKTSEKITQYKLVPYDYELTEDTKVSIKLINKETCLYYRDLWAHRLGATVSETYIGIFFDGMMFAVGAFNTSFLRRLQETYIFESFCFNGANKKFENLNRLAMLILLSGEFQKWLYKEVLASQPYVEMKSMRTTCLAKYRKVKLNNGLLELLNVEKMPNGLYKLLYEQPFFQDRTYKDCIKIFLKDDARINADYAKEHGIEIKSLPTQQKAKPKRQRR